MKNLMISLLALCAIPSQALTLKSADIAEGQLMDKRFEANVFGCKGENLSPHLEWDDVPEGTKSFAITVYDPDAPTGSGFWHWQVINLPKNLTELKRGAANMPEGTLQVANDYGTASFGGACPPEGHGMHRYVFTVWALPTETLGVNASTSSAVVGYMLNHSALDKASLTATYAR